jgi:hypothetical protein
MTAKKPEGSTKFILYVGPTITRLALSLPKSETLTSGVKYEKIVGMYAGSYPYFQTTFIDKKGRVVETNHDDPAQMLDQSKLIFSTICGELYKRINKVQKAKAKRVKLTSRALQFASIHFAIAVPKAQPVKDRIISPEKTGPNTKPNNGEAEILNILSHLQLSITSATKLSPR